MSEEKHGERIAKVEQITENHKARIERLESNNDVLVRLSTLMEVQTEINKKTTEQMEKFGKVLDSVGENLAHLNSKYDQMEANVEIMGNEVKSIKKTQAEAQENTKIDTGKLVKNIIVGVLMLSVTLIGAWLLRVTGLK